MKKVTVKRLVAMPVAMPFYEIEQDGFGGRVRPSNAVVNWGLRVFEVLTKLQNRGVKPGTKLRIVIETVSE